MAATEAGFREYLRLPEENRENLALYLNAARSKSRAAGIPEFQDNGHYELFLYTLAGISPPIEPSTVFLGLTLGASLCLPKVRPAK